MFCEKLSQKMDALIQASNYMSKEKLMIPMNAFFNSQFG